MPLGSPLILLLSAVVVTQVSASKSLGDILARLTAKIEDSQFNGARCDLLLLDVDDGLLWSNVSLEVLSAGRTVVSASLEGSDLSAVSDVLHRQARCVFLLAEVRQVDRVSFEKYADFIRQVPRGVVITFGGQVVEAIVANPVRDKPMLHLHVIGAVTHGYAFCFPENDDSTMDVRGPMLIDKTLVLVWGANSQDASRDEVNPFAKCLHPLRHKTIYVSFSGLPPHFMGEYDDKGKPIGSDIKMMNLMAERFHFDPVYLFVDNESCLTNPMEPANLDCVTKFIFFSYEISHGMSTFGFGGLGFFHVTSLMVEATASVHVLQYTFVTTKPKLLPAYGNLIEAFSGITWVLLYIVLGLIFLGFWLISSTYRTLGVDADLWRVPWYDFLILPATRYSQPLPWFKRRWSAGRFLTLFWGLFIMMMIFFYTCNLRAILIARDYESPLETLEDVVGRGSRIFAHMGIQHELINPDLSELEAYPHFLAIDKVMKDNKGYFGGAVVPEEVMREVTSDGAIYMAPEDSIPYEYFNNKTYALSNLQVMANPNLRWFTAYRMPKDMPWREEVNSYLEQVKAMGFVQKFMSDPLPIEATIAWSPNLEEKVLQPMTLTHILVPIWLLGAGLGMGILAFCWETVHIQCVKDNKP